MWFQATFSYKVQDVEQDVINIILVELQIKKADIYQEFPKTTMSNQNKRM